MWKRAVQQHFAYVCLGRHYLSHLLAVKKFRKRGNKDGALRAFYKLEGEQLGTVLELNSAKGGSQKVSALMPPLKYLCNPFLSAI